MLRFNKLTAVFAAVLLALMLVSTSCFGGTASSGSSNSPTPSVLVPQPRVENVVATTTGTESAYYATLDIKVRNDGAEGTILVVASLTQAGKTAKNQMPVFLKKGESHELKMTFPLVWQGGEFTTNVQTIIP
jgi:hypothetical protein